VSRLMRALFLLIPFIATPALAHDEWANGNPVPAWVKNACCGPDDVHHLTSQQVHPMSDGWHVEGYRSILPYGRELPSQDGDYWIFYRTSPDGAQTPVYCFFAPRQAF
jgi:hypothetical protein